eukprot:6837903-Heterocapsa_arctica.AAC.1
MLEHVRARLGVALTHALVQEVVVLLSGQLDLEHAIDDRLVDDDMGHVGGRRRPSLWRGAGAGLSSLRGFVA